MYPLVTSHFPTFKNNHFNAIVDFEDEDEEEILASIHSSSISSQAVCENFLQATPTADLERSVKADIWQIICSSSDDHTKMKSVYDIVCGFPRRLINQGDTLLSEVA